MSSKHTTPQGEARIKARDKFNRLAKQVMARYQLRTRSQLARMIKINEQTAGGWMREKSTPTPGAPYFVRAIEIMKGLLDNDPSVLPGHVSVAAPPEQAPGADPNYASLRAVLDAAYGQSATGKGNQRHGNGLPFEGQRMQTISRLIGGDGGMEYQAIKKLTEGLDMADPAARERELLGVLVYVAGIVVYHRQEVGDANG